MDGVIAAVGLGITCGTYLVGVTVHAVNTRHIAKDALHKARNVESVAARKDVLDERFLAIKNDLKDIKETLKSMQAGGVA